MKFRIVLFSMVAGLMSLMAEADVNSGNTTSVTVSASADTFISEYSAYGDSIPRGENFLVLIGGITGLHRTYPLVKFDLSSYAGEEIVSSTVDFVVDIRSGWGDGFVTQSVSVRESLDAWEEQSVTYANYAGVGFNASIHTGGNLVTRNVTYHGITEPVIFTIPATVVQRWIDDPESNNGLFLVSNTSATCRDMSFWSKELGDAPRLVFELEGEPLSDVLVSASPDAGGHVTGGGEYVEGSEVTLTAVPAEGYSFASWSDGVEEASRQVVVAAGGVEYIALFSPIPRGCLEFSKPVYSVSEDGSYLILSVERVGGSYGEASVQYAPTNGTALAGLDFTLEPGMLAWANGQAGAKSVIILINNNDRYEGNKEFSVRLHDASGTSIGDPDSSMITIVDDEAPPARISRIEGALDFGDVPMNLPAIREIEVWNDGSLTLSVTNVQTPPQFIVAPQAFMVPAGEVVTLNVKFVPEELGAYSGTLSLLSDATGGETSVALSGTGVAPVESAAIRTIQGSTAVITLVVPADANVLGVEDELPSGMSAYSISDGGSWDAINNKVKWFFSSPGQIRDRALHYTVNITGQVVAGTVNFGDSNEAVIGDEQFVGEEDLGFLHPSDDNGDWRIELSEVSGGVSRWRSGVDDVKTPVVTRGITLYLAGESYRYDAEVGAEAKRWVPLAEPEANSEAVAFAAYAELVAAPVSSPVAGAVRSVQATNVAISVMPDPGTTAWGLEEKVPADVEVESISHGGSWDSVHRKIKWVFYDGEERAITYRVKGQPGACAGLNGVVSFDGSDDSVSGDAMAAVTLPFEIWKQQKSLSNEVTFNSENHAYGLPHGLIYALNSELEPGEREIVIRFANGKKFAEIPSRNMATVPSVDVIVEGTDDLSSGEWDLIAIPAADQSRAPQGKQWFQLDEMSDKAFYRVKAVAK